MRLAQKEMDQYLKDGPKKSTRWLLEPLMNSIEEGDSVLDIGGGVGALILELQKKNIGSCYYVDISESYSAVFRHEVSNKLLTDKIHIHTGDFTKKHPLMPQTDVVALDKVLCCYQDFQVLLDLSLGKAKKILAYTVPDSVWWVKAIHSIEITFKRFFTKKLITFIHSVDQMESAVIEKGFRKVFQQRHAGWLTVVYSKDDQRSYGS